MLKLNYASKYGALLLFCSTLAFAHGENKPGPNGGHIRMPGAFHTELVQGSQSSFTIYLLDVEFKNPITAGSSVTAQFKTKAKVSVMPCQAKAENFICTLPKGNRARKSDQILITAQRSGVSGGTAIYEMPLSFASKSPGHSPSHSSEHSSH